VTAKLSRDFYDRFGDKVANELVEWFNQVDATYRGDLRELNELNFARFDATQGRRLAESDAKWAQRMALWDKRFAEADAKLERRFAESDVRWEQRFAQIDVRFAAFEARILRWMFVFWVTTLAAVVGLARFRP
jgi:hypothetical protein